MKITIRELTNSLPALQDLANKPMKAQTAYYISKIMVEINELLIPYNETVSKLVEKYGGTQVEGVISFSEDPKNHREIDAKFMEELEPVRNEKIELVKSKKISVKKLNDIEISPGIMMALDWMLEE